MNSQDFRPEEYRPSHFRWDFDDGVAAVTLDRPERKNPLTFQSYAELRDLFRTLVYVRSVKAVVIAGAGGNFSSGGDVHEIIGPLTEREMPGLLEFTRMTGDLVKAMRACPQPIVAALDGVCVGAGAIVAMASDIRIATPETKTAFLFTRVGLAGCDMGACAILPRIIGQGRASELLFTGRVMTADEGERWGFHNRLVPAAGLLDEARALARNRSSPRSTASAPAPARSSPWLPICGSRRRARRRRSCSPASVLPAATWAPARSCRGSSAKAAPRSCSSPAGR